MKLTFCLFLSDLLETDRRRGWRDRQEDWWYRWSKSLQHRTWKTESRTRSNGQIGRGEKTGDYYSCFFLFLCVVFVVVVELRVWCSSSAHANRSCDEILWGYSPLFTYTWRDDSVIANRVWLHYHGPLTAQFTHWMTESNCREEKTCVVS